MRKQPRGPPRRNRVRVFRYRQHQTMETNMNQNTQEANTQTREETPHETNMQTVDPDDLKEVAEFFQMDVESYANMHDYNY